MPSARAALVDHLGSGYLSSEGDEVYYRTAQVLAVADTNDRSVRWAIDRSKITCPFRELSELDAGFTNVAATARGRAFFVNDWCGAWSVPLDNPSEVQPMIGAEKDDAHFPLAVSSNGQLVCFEGKDGVELWSIDDRGARETKLFSTTDHLCDEVAGDRNEAFLSVDHQLLHWKSGDSTPTLIATPPPPPPFSLARVEGLQLGEHALYYQGDLGIMRVSREDLSVATELACTAYSSPDCPAFLVTGDDLYLASPRAIVVRRGPSLVRSDEPVFTGTKLEYINTFAGLSSAANELWFALDFNDSVNGGTYLAHVPQRR